MGIISGSIWGSFQGWGSFRGRDHFGGCTDQINLLRNGRDSDLKQIENAFKDPEARFWERKSSDGIVGSILGIRGQCSSVTPK